MTKTMPILLSDWASVRPKTRTVTAAIAIPGTAMMMSRMRMMVSEMALRVTAAIDPMIAPKKSAITVEHRPMSSE